MGTIKICLLGCGGFARYAHGPCHLLVRQMRPDVEYSACCDLDLEKARSYAEKFDIPHFYSDWREMVKQESPNGIFIRVPVTYTSRVASEVLTEGIPVMMEKPPGRNREEIQAIIDASRRSNTPAMVAFNRRYSPIFEQMLNIWKNEAQSEPIEHVRCDFYRPERLDPDFSTTAIHGIDALRHISGGRYIDAQFIYQELQRELPARNVYMNARFDNGAYGYIAFLPSTGVRFERYALNTRHWTLIANTVTPEGGGDFPGSIEVFHNGYRLRVESPAPHPFNQIENYLGGYYGENLEFAERLAKGFPAFPDLEMSLDAVEIADCIRLGKSNWAHSDVI